MESKREVFPCNTCSVKFPSSRLQRSHMRQAWHIYNLRLRVDGLPALSEEEYEGKFKDCQAIHREEHQGKRRHVRNGAHDVDVERSHHLSRNMAFSEQHDGASIPPTQCLFCSVASSSLAGNMHHMASVHGLFIPSPHRLTDPASFLGYLSIIIFNDNECLFCGISKSTSSAVQSHMRAKGHCMLNLPADSELLDFWDPEEGQEEEEEEEEEEEDGPSIPGAAERDCASAVKLSRTEMRLPSGALISSRPNSTRHRLRPGSQRAIQQGSRHGGELDPRMRAITAHGEASEQASASPRQVSLRRQSRKPCQEVAVRGQMGLVGLSESARRALLKTEMKMRRREVVVKAAWRYAAEQEPVKTKYYKTEAPIYQAG